ncbi:MAG: hypothetical protein WA885_17125 [Phormidesmis sp.]
MKNKSLAIATLAASAAIFSQPFSTNAQAATLGGSSTCAKATFSYLDCAGSFDGNDKGAQGTGLDNLNTLFGSGWSFSGDNEDGLVSFSSGGEGSKTGSATTTLSGFGAIAVKAGNSYSLYTVKDLASFDWSTAGVNTVGKKGNMPGLSHVSIYVKNMEFPSEEEQEIPEPSMFLGLAAMMSFGSRLKRNA